MSSTPQEISRALEHRRALLRALRFELDRAIRLKAAAARTVSESKDVVLRAEALLDDVYIHRKSFRFVRQERAASGSRPLAVT